MFQEYELYFQSRRKNMTLEWYIAHRKSWDQVLVGQQRLTELGEPFLSSSFVTNSGIAPTHPLQPPLQKVSVSFILDPSLNILSSEQTLVLLAGKGFSSSLRPQNFVFPSATIWKVTLAACLMWVSPNCVWQEKGLLLIAKLLLPPQLRLVTPHIWREQQVQVRWKLLNV